jgi:glycosyltransferase involved in cell wall biosynthesis
MKLIIFSQHFWPEKFRINTIIRNLSDNFKIDKISVFTAKPNYPSGIIEQKYNNFRFQSEFYHKSQIEIYRVPILSRGNASSMRLALNYLSYIFFGTLYLKKIKKNDIAFVYCTSPVFQCIPAIIYSRLKKIPLIIWLQDLWPESIQETGHIKNRFILKIIKWISYKIYNSVDLILCQSEEFADHLHNLNLKTRLEVLHNPAKENKFLSNFENSKNFKKKIIFTGNLGKAQNLKNLSYALEKLNLNTLNQVEFHFYGDGSEKIKFKNNILSSGVSKSIYFHEPIFGDEYDSVMKNADAFLLPLKSGEAFSKTIPAKFQTYLSYYKPIISLADGAIYKIIKNNNLGFASESNDFESFKLNISKFLSLNNQELIQINNNCKSIFQKKFTLKVISEKLYKILKNEIYKSSSYK